MRPLAMNDIDTITERREYVYQLREQYADSGKTVYDRADRWLTEHEDKPSCAGNILHQSDERYDGIWVVSCPEHGAVLVFDTQDRFSDLRLQPPTKWYQLD